MDTNPLVSILVPAYNAAPWLGETIESALAQTWQRKEIIIVDDGSSDNTLEIAKLYEGKGVKVATQKNSGAAAARNTAFELSKGDYIQWLDADDLLSKNKIAIQMEKLQSKGLDKSVLLSCAWGSFLHRASKAKFVPSRLWTDLQPNEWLLRKLGQGLHMQPSTWLASRQLVESIGPWDTRLSLDDDGEFFCRMVSKSNGIVFVPGAKVFYRKAAPNRLSRVDPLNPAHTKKLDSQFLSIQLQLQYLHQCEDSQRVLKASTNYLQKYLFDFTPERPDLVQKSVEIATQLGSDLHDVKPTWKYYIPQKLFGWRFVKILQHFIVIARHLIFYNLDKILFEYEKKRATKI